MTKRKTKYNEANQHIEENHKPNKKGASTYGTTPQHNTKTPKNKYQKVLQKSKSTIGCN
jgi:hypothetical protein